MTDIEYQLVREFFELNQFRVLTQWKHDVPRKSRGDSAIQLYVEAPHHDSEEELDINLKASDIACIRRAVVAVRAWHTEKFYASVITANPVLTQFAEEASLIHAQDTFNGQPFKTILVLSELPSTQDQHALALGAIRDAGVDHVIEFPTLLRDIIDKTSDQGAYAPSHSLQMIQLLKRYKFIRNQQMEFPFPVEPPSATSPPLVETDQPEES